jgi:hypothetical protein
MLVAGCMATVIAGTVTVAEAHAWELATDVAVTVTCKSLTGGGGAMYVVAVPLAVVVGEILPQDAATQDTFQLTPWLLESWLTVAVSWVVPPPIAVPEDGETATVIGGGGEAAEPPPHPKLLAVRITLSITPRTKLRLFALTITGLHPEFINSLGGAVLTGALSFSQIFRGRWQDGNSSELVLFLHFAYRPTH